MSDGDGIPIDVTGINDWPSAVVVGAICLTVVVVLIVARDIWNRREARRGLDVIRSETAAKIAAVGDSITNGQKDYVVRKDIESRFTELYGRMDGQDRRLDGIGRDLGTLTRKLLSEPEPPRRRTAADRVDSDDV